jgi:hypothetical protein
MIKVLTCLRQAGKLNLTYKYLILNKASVTLSLPA